MIELNYNELHESQEFVQQIGESKWAAAEARVNLASPGIALNGNNIDGYTSTDVTQADTNKNLIIKDDIGTSLEYSIDVSSEDIVQIKDISGTQYNNGDYSNITDIYLIPSLVFSVDYVNDLGDIPIEELKWISLNNTNAGLNIDETGLFYNIPVTPLIANKIKYNIISKQDGLQVDKGEIKTYVPSGGITVDCELTPEQYACIADDTLVDDLSI